MNLPPLRWLCGLLLFAVVGKGDLRADLSANFAAPPFAMNQTIIGIDGWELRYGSSHPIYNDPEEARIAESPWEGGRAVLALKTAVKNAGFQPRAGERHTLTATMGVEFKPALNFDGGIVVCFSADFVSGPLQFGFSYDAEGGLFHTTRTGRDIVLKKSEIRQNAPYHIVIRLDYGAETYDIAITGPKEDGTELRYEKKGVPFQEGYSGERVPKGLFLFNHRPTLMTGYFESIAVGSGVPN